MRISPVSSISSLSSLAYQPDTSEVVERFQSITSIVGRQRAQGAEEVSMVLRNDNAVDAEVIKRLTRLYNDVDVQYNGGPSVKLTINF